VGGGGKAAVGWLPPRDALQKAEVRSWTAEGARATRDYRRPRVFLHPERAAEFTVQAGRQRLAVWFRP